MKKQLNKITRQLIKSYKPEKMVLFGSMLSGKPANDIDLFLIKKTKLSRLGERAGEARKCLPDQRIPVDFLIFTPNEVKIELERGNVFIAEILEEGRVLYEQKS